MSQEEKKVLTFTILAGTLIAVAHGIEIRATHDVEVEVVGSDSYDMAAEVLVGAKREDLLPRLEHVEEIETEDKGRHTVTVRYNPIAQRMIQDDAQAVAEKEA